MKGGNVRKKDYKKFKPIHILVQIQNKDIELSLTGQAGVLKNVNQLQLIQQNSEEREVRTSSKIESLYCTHSSKPSSALPLPNSQGFSQQNNHLESHKKKISLNLAKNSQQVYSQIENAEYDLQSRKILNIQPSEQSLKVIPHQIKLTSLNSESSTRNLKALVNSTETQADFILQTDNILQKNIFPPTRHLPMLSTFQITSDILDSEFSRTSRSTVAKLIPQFSERQKELESNKQVYSQSRQKHVSILIPSATELIPSIAQPHLKIKTQLARVLDPKFSSSILSVASYSDTNPIQKSMLLENSKNPMMKIQENSSSAFAKESYTSNQLNQILRPVLLKQRIAEREKNKSLNVQQSHTFDLSPQYQKHVKKQQTQHSFMIKNPMKIILPKVTLPATAENIEKSKEILASREGHSVKNYDHFSEQNSVVSPASGQFTRNGDTDLQLDLQIQYKAVGVQSNESLDKLKTEGSEVKMSQSMQYGDISSLIRNFQMKQLANQLKTQREINANLIAQNHTQFNSQSDFKLEQSQTNLENTLTNFIPNGSQFQFSKVHTRDKLSENQSKIQKKSKLKNKISSSMWQTENIDNTFLTMLNNSSKDLKQQTLQLNISSSNSIGLTQSGRNFKSPQPHLNKDQTFQLPQPNIAKQNQVLHSNKQIVYVIKGGSNLKEQGSLCFKFDLKKHIAKYCQIQKKSDLCTPRDNYDSLQRLKNFGVAELIELTNRQFQSEVPNLKGGERQQFNSLYTLDGLKINSLDDLNNKTKYLIACYDEFEPLRIEKDQIKEQTELIMNFAKQVVEQSKIDFDSNTTPRVPTRISYKTQDSHFLTVQNSTNLTQRVTLPKLKKSDQPPPLFSDFNSPKTIKPLITIEDSLESNSLQLHQEHLTFLKQIENARILEISQRRQHWRDTYFLDDKQLFQLFSEYTALAMIAHQKIVESEANSIQMRFKKTAESKDYLANILPFSGSTTKYIVEDRKQKEKLFKLTRQELQDFRIPVETFKNNCKILRNTKEPIKDRILKAISADSAMVDWESFLLITKLLNPKCPDKEQVRQFIVNFFSPGNSLVTSSEFETLFKNLFTESTKGQKEQDSSLVEGLLQELQRLDVYKRKGFLNKEKLYEAIKQSVIDLDVLVQAIQG